MSKPFDATLNALIAAHVGDWAAFLAARTGLPPGPATPLDTDLSTTRQADRLFRVDGPVPWALHLELEATGRRGIPAELLSYYVAAKDQTGLPVETVLLLLRPKATARDLTGVHRDIGPTGRVTNVFRYRVIRAWTLSVADVLTAGPGLAPLALLPNEARADLPGTVDRLDGRLRAAGLPDNVRGDMLFAAKTLGGLRYQPAAMADLFRRYDMVLEASSVWQAYQQEFEARIKAGVAQGEARGKLLAFREVVLKVGSKRFGSPTARQAAALGAVADITRLERAFDRVEAATGWDDLLAP